jgi:glycosyltransferase involved in cell wall biosynthesis
MILTELHMREPLQGWIWVSWEKHRRTESLCQEFGVPLFVKTVSLPLILRQIYLCCWTVILVARKRPKGVITQNPSTVLAALAVFFRPVFQFRVVVDAHNEAVTPFIWTYGWVDFLCRYLHRAADVTIVTNESLADIVRRNGGRPVILEDKIPSLTPCRTVLLKGEANIACISTFSKDEPIREIIDAIRNLGQRYHVYMTGNSKRWVERDSVAIPENLELTGYLSEEEYEVLLNSVDVILDLTLMDNCLVCGAYEGVALGKPLVLSESSASRWYFSSGVIHTKNDAAHIHEAIVKAIASRVELSEEIVKLRHDLEGRWQERKQRLIEIITSME